MTKTTQALLLKIIMTFAAAWVAFGFIDNNILASIFIISLLGTALNYLLGDLVVLPMLGNIVASLGDGVMAALTAYIYSLIIPQFTTSLFSLVLFAGIVAGVEYFFHKYLISTKKVAPNK
ncbi:MAG: hypothetical protein JM58_14540 [Peptococcaceae bacterium BICA1-8]|nr:MAG: hypothetical protein JM58_14540 [Peptococcaceae bacterium BICA1-8]